MGQVDLARFKFAKTKFGPYGKVCMKKNPKANKYKGLFVMSVSKIYTANARRCLWAYYTTHLVNILLKL